MFKLGLKSLSSTEGALATLGKNLIIEKKIVLLFFCLIFRNICLESRYFEFQACFPLHSSTSLTSHLLERNYLLETVQFGIFKITTVYNYPVQHPLSRFFICRVSTASYSQINRSGTISFIGTQQLHEFLHFIFCFHEASHFWETINSRCASVSLVFFTSSNVSKSI